MGQNGDNRGKIGEHFAWRTRCANVLSHAPAPKYMMYNAPPPPRSITPAVLGSLSVWGINGQCVCGGGGGGWHKALVVGSGSLWRRLLASRP